MILVRDDASSCPLFIIVSAVVCKTQPYMPGYAPSRLKKMPDWYQRQHFLFSHHLSIRFVVSLLPPLCFSGMDAMTGPNESQSHAKPADTFLSPTASRHFV